LPSVTHCKVICKMPPFRPNGLKVSCHAAQRLGEGRRIF
jgi:hypothetical protein